MTVGSPVLRAETAGSLTGMTVLAGLATAIVHLLPPEVPEAKQQGEHAPAGREQPQMRRDEGRIAVRAAELAERVVGREVVLDQEVGHVPVRWLDPVRPCCDSGPGRAVGSIRRLGAEGAFALRGQQRLADQGDVDGSSCAKSLMRAPVLAANKPIPALNMVSSASAGMTSSQSQVSGSPLARMRTKSTAIDSSICCSSIIT